MPEDSKDVNMGRVANSLMSTFATRAEVEYRFGYQQPLLAPTGGETSKALFNAAERLEASAKITESTFTTLGTIVGAGIGFASGGPTGMLSGAFVGALAGGGAGSLIGTLSKMSGVKSESVIKEEFGKSMVKEVMEKMAQDKGFDYTRTLATIGRLGAGISASGGQMGFGGMVGFGSVSARLGVSSEEVAGWMQGAMGIGGVRGAGAVNPTVLVDAVKSGIYGSGGEIAAAIAQGARFGFKDHTVLAAARELGTTVGEASGMMVGLKLSNIMGQAGIENRLMGRGIMSTEIGRERPELAVGITNQLFQGTTQAAHGNDAIEMLQFAQYRASNPGATYMQYHRDKLAGFRTQRGMNMIGAIAEQGMQGGLQNEMVASTALGGFSTEGFNRRDIRQLLSLFGKGIARTEASKEGEGAPFGLEEKAALAGMQDQGANLRTIQMATKIYDEYGQKIETETKKIVELGDTFKLLGDYAVIVTTRIRETMKDMNIGPVKEGEWVIWSQNYRLHPDLYQNPFRTDGVKKEYNKNTKKWE